MPSASVFLYGRRSRSSRTIDNPTTSSSSSSSSPSDSDHRHRNRYRRRSFADLSLHHRHSISFDDADHIHTPPPPPPHPPHHSFLSPIQESEVQQRQCDGESSSQDINNRETVRDLSRRLARSNRLPGPVLLAKERLLQRLRNVSVSSARQNRETSPSFLCNDFWVIDADWETNGFGELTTSEAILRESLAEAHQEPMPEEPKKKPLGLSKKTLSQLHHELFTEHQNSNTCSTSKPSNECSICLENFVEGNELVSLPCRHRFHHLCLYPWLQTCGDCPYCRSSIVLTS